MELTETEVSQLMVVVSATVRQRFGGHPEFDDLVSEATIAAWESLQAAPPMPLPQALSWARRRALWELANWYRDRRNPSRQHTRRGVDLPGLVSWEQLKALESEPSPDLEGGRAAGGALLAADWEAALLADCEAEGWIGRLIAARVIAPMEWEAILRTVMDQEPAESVAAELGLTLREFRQRVEAALERLRAEARGQTQAGTAMELFGRWQEEDRCQRR